MTAEQGAGFAPPGGANVFRGLIVIGLAVLIGIALMARGITSDDAVVAGDETTDSTETGTTDDGTGADTGIGAETGTTDETTAATVTTVAEEPVVAAELPRDPASVAVVVLNANGGKGVAGAATQKLDARNYVTANPEDANSTGNSVIFYEDGYLADANEIATALGVADPAAVVQLLDPSSAAATSDKRQGANVMVFVGNDGLIPT